MDTQKKQFNPTPTRAEERAWKDARFNLSVARHRVQVAERNLEDAQGRDEIQFMRGALSVLRLQEHVANEAWLATPDIPDPDEDL